MTLAHVEFNKEILNNTYSMINIINPHSFYTRLSSQQDKRPQVNCRPALVTSWTITHSPDAHSQALCVTLWELNIIQA